MTCPKSSRGPAGAVATPLDCFGASPPRPPPPPPPPTPPPPPPRPPLAKLHATRCIPAAAENGSGAGRQSAEVLGILPAAGPPPAAGWGVAALEKVRRTVPPASRI